MDELKPILLTLMAAEQELYSMPVYYVPSVGDTVRPRTDLGRYKVESILWDYAGPYPAATLQLQPDQ
jgi:hypothetical protein